MELLSTVYEIPNPALLISLMSAFRLFFLKTIFKLKTASQQRHRIKLDFCLTNNMKMLDKPKNLVNHGTEYYSFHPICFLLYREG